jgi:hypothetical protein
MLCCRRQRPTVYVDGRPQVSCSYDPGKIANLKHLDLITWMGNVEPTEKPG